MLRSVNELYNYVLEAEDGDIGRCKDFLFDDELWTIRYMVADTGKWLPGRKVLISPVSLGPPISLGPQNLPRDLFPVKLTMEKIKNSPSLDSDAPVSRQYESKWLGYYGFPYYWGGNADENDPHFRSTAKGDPHLRSATEVMGYHIQAKDDEIGHVEDFLLDDETWIIHYMVVDTRNWLPGRKVLVTPAWIDSVDWGEKNVSVDLTREQVKNSPKYDPSIPVTREYEEGVYDFYDRPKYWE
ncbi:MAG: PRC-barrel domain-containing protein [Thermodesulfobacteriota bacterium]|nr:PRC-barrel domain-containing protein [Thermodesulfobacteriota bacterium]